MLCALQSPMYLHPVMSFVDDQCHIFSQDEENSFSYTKIHDDFKEMVDSLLTDFLEELGVTPSVTAQYKTLPIIHS